MESAYDPPIVNSSRRGRSASFSASSAPRSASRTRRQSLSSAPTSDFKRPSLGLSDDEVDQPQARQPLIDLEEHFRASLDEPQDPSDAAADRAVAREGRQSKQERLTADPNYHVTGDMGQFMAQLYDLTHTIDALDTDIDQIVAVRNKIVALDPSVDVGQVSLQADLHVLAALTTDSGKRVVSLETWLLQLHQWSKKVKNLVKSGKAGATAAEIGEIKFELANAKLDFAAAMERIREGAYKEQQKRERTRIWMARHIRAREPEIEDVDVVGLLKAAELGAADGVMQSHVTSYAGLWALQNPFTEIAELTNGMRFLHDELDREIVDKVTGKDTPKRIIYLNGVYARGRPNASVSNPVRDGVKQASWTRPRSWFSSRAGRKGGATDFDDKFRYMQAKVYTAEKDLEYGFARQQQLDRTSFRKKMVIALLLVVIAALVLFISLATMRIPGETTSLALDAFETPTSSFVWGQDESLTSKSLATTPRDGPSIPSSSPAASPVATADSSLQAASKVENSLALSFIRSVDLAMATGTGSIFSPSQSRVTDTLDPTAVASSNLANIATTASGTTASSVPSVVALQGALGVPPPVAAGAV
ncbi:hypothetical protein JCM11491_005648 [Sporobolomyces phaffii]